MSVPRRQSILVDMASFDVEEQRREYERFMQEKADRELAVRIDEQYRQAAPQHDDPPGPPPNNMIIPIVIAGTDDEDEAADVLAPLPPIAPRPDTPAPAARRTPVRRTTTTARTRRTPVRPAAAPAAAAPPAGPGPIRRGRASRWTTSATVAPPAPIAQPARPVLIVQNALPAPRAQPAPAAASSSRVVTAAVHQIDAVRSYSSDSDLDVEEIDSDLEVDMAIVLPTNRIAQPLQGNDRDMYAREMELAQVDFGQSTSTAAANAYNPPPRSGVPNGTWGECTMCFEAPINPQGCNACLQVIGCKTCVNSWLQSSERPSCPLCRRKWTRRAADVSTMPTIDRRRRQRDLPTASTSTNNIVRGSRRVIN